MLSQLQLFRESVNLGESLVSYQPNGLTFSPACTDTQLINVGHRLMAVRSYLKWSLGSLLAEMADRRTEDAESWISDFCTAHALDPKDRREMVGVATFYRAATDLPPLSYEHCREAMWGAGGGAPGGLSRALGYLRIAHTDNLTYTQLRRLIRTQQAADTPPEPEQPNLSGYSIIFDFMRYARTQLPSVASYTPERAALILHDLGDALAFIDALRTKANTSE